MWLRQCRSWLRRARGKVSCSGSVVSDASTDAAFQRAFRLAAEELNSQEQAEYALRELDRRWFGDGLLPGEREAADRHERLYGRPLGAPDTVLDGIRASHLRLPPSLPGEQPAAYPPPPRSAFLPARLRPVAPWPESESGESEVGSWPMARRGGPRITWNIQLASDTDEDDEPLPGPQPPRQPAQARGGPSSASRAQPACPAPLPPPVPAPLVRASNWEASTAVGLPAPTTVPAGSPGCLSAMPANAPKHRSSPGMEPTLALGLALLPRAPSSLAIRAAHVPALSPGSPQAPCLLEAPLVRTSPSLRGFSRSGGAALAGRLPAAPAGTGCVGGLGAMPPRGRPTEPSVKRPASEGGHADARRRKLGTAGDRMRGGGAAAGHSVPGELMATHTAFENQA